MNEKNHLERIAQHFADMQLDAVMIGGAAAMVHGSPVMTLDVDFVVKQTDENYRKLAALAQRMNCRFIEVKLPNDNYMYRFEHRTEPLLIDFLFAPAGIESFESLKANGMDVLFGEHPLRIAALEDILASKRAAGRPKDLAVIPILEMTLNENQTRENPT
jgi:hypothetical protein